MRSLCVAFCRRCVQREKFFASLGIGHVPVWGLISEEVLENAAALEAEYKDDGEEH